MKKKKAFCKYDTTVGFEAATECLRLYLPTEDGYINFNLAHTVSEERNADVWRLAQAYWADDNLENEYKITPHGAEWDMALSLCGRPDFIGGYAHGDERFTAFSLLVDGKETELSSLDSLTVFEKIFITESSVGYDPLDGITPVLLHTKEYTVTERGVSTSQSVEWLGTYSLGSSYLAMMPPIKSLTDTFYTDTDNSPKPTSENLGYKSNAKEAVVYGKKSGFSYKMSVPRLSLLNGAGRFILTDNGGNAYNKIYFCICTDESVNKGDLWLSTTEYSIEKAIKKDF